LPQLISESQELESTQALFQLELFWIGQANRPVYMLKGIPAGIEGHL